MADTPPGDMLADRSAVTAALEVFARDGFAAATLSDLADATGMSKRMLHYHFGDKRGLYEAAYRHAIGELTPPQEILSRPYTIPAEGMRRFVDALFHRFQRSPACVRLVLRENTDHVLEHGDDPGLRELSDVLLHVERILLLGQDSGAFRPGVSADDVLVLVCSLSMFRESNGDTMRGLLRLDLSTQRNTEGLRRMAIDTVLAFLTSNLPDSGYGSYVEPADTPDTGENPAGDVYDLDGGIY
ncbi:TetR/AcrR family transcriptional regulator [Corynebacterium timonense]|uniref:Transcriptional regulator, TetR family n=1 Tax=Corynebacterium timonense TaxID=441500 RepID=A0A1H1LVU5_9CORY|nr:TetR/AcrR family transcriptional regulator [Corynebacterium timonense]SDR78155.1 transcriptional regulator, TetR family [Corynebacterium timonense]